MTDTSTRRRRFPRLRTLIATIAALAVLPTGALPAAATSNEEPNWWYTGMHVEDARNEGLTGAGVKIAVIDAQINPNLNLFTGASLTVDPVTSCDVPVTSQDVDAAALHGTASAALIVARPVGELPMQGIAPDAAVTFYSSGAEDCVGRAGEASPTMAAIARAVADGNRIISISEAQTFHNDEDAEVIADALAAGVVIVSSTANTQEQRAAVAPSQFNGVVSVAAVSRDGMLLTDAGRPVITPSVTVVAPGVNILVPGSANGWDRMSSTNGSSVATPLVAGALALLLQKYPTATGNQLIQALITTTSQSREGQPRNDTNGGGYGAISLPYLLAADPTTLPDVNPLMNQPLGVPTREQITGDTPTPTPTAVPTTAIPPTSSPTSTPEPPVTTPPAAESAPDTLASVLPWLIGGGSFAMVIIVVLVIVLATRTRKPRL
ncbi:S8 family peptidase [Microbacterium sp. ZW T5_56]|uniref:S8 family peptidase n=1 Tax=Microbacterium sp. ZW T5_56 TaxID=3378081 RepID=UPI003854E0D2